MFRCIKNLWKGANTRPDREVGTGYLSALQENPYGHRRKVLFFIERIEALRKQRGLSASQVDILDVGCGNGKAVTFPLGERGYSITGLDFHHPSIEYAETINRLDNVKYVFQDAWTFTSEAKYDVVLLSDVLEHMAEAKRFLLQLKLLLKGDGIILIAIPNGYGPFEIESMLVRDDRGIRLWERCASIVLWMFRMLLRIARAVEKVGRLGGVAKEGSSNGGGGNRAAVSSPGEKGDTENTPYNYECGHVQFFSMTGFKRLIRESGYEISAFEKGCFNCGPLTVQYLYGSPRIMDWNIRMGKYLPHFLCSVWYFECRNAGMRGG